MIIQAPGKSILVALMATHRITDKATPPPKVEEYNLPESCRSCTQSSVCIQPQAYQPLYRIEYRPRHRNY